MGIKKLLIAALALVVIFGGGLFAGYKIFSTPFPELPELPDVAEVVVEDTSKEVITAISRSGEVSLLSLQIQGINGHSETQKIFGVEVPGSERAVFIEYGFNAKLGINGAEVRIEQTAENAYTVTIPEFIFIGHDDIELRTATQSNGALSWITPNIDTVAMTNEILSGNEQATYINRNDEILRDQARNFYNGIVMAIDPEITLSFEFESEPSSEGE